MQARWSNKDAIEACELTSVTLRPNVVLSTISISLSDLQTIRSVTGV